MNLFQIARGILFDLEGVLYAGGELIDGAVETIELVNRLGIPHRFVTNTTTSPRAAIADKLQRFGFAVQPDEILTATSAASVYLQQKNIGSIYPVVSDAVICEFKNFSITEDKPDAVIIGDIGTAWSYELINSVFRMIMAGAELVALHKGKYWQNGGELAVDIGAFVSGLEYVTGKTAAIIGKPAQTFYQAALTDLQLGCEDVVMIGDDIDSDVGGAQQAGLKGVLVKTGKYRVEYATRSTIQPDQVLESVANLKELL